MNKTRSMRWTVFAVAIALASACPVWADSDDNSDNVNFLVPSGIEITSDNETEFDLVFNDGTVEDSVSSGYTVFYTVQANNMPNAALTGAVSAKIDALVDGITLKAFPGDYTNTGSTGNATLDKVGDEVVITTTAANVYDKPATTGSAGKVLNGTLPIHYRGIADRDLSDADGGTAILTVTLKDA